MCNGTYSVHPYTILRLEGKALSTNNNVHKIDCIQEINVLKAASNAGEVWCALVLVSTY